MADLDTPHVQVRERAALSPAGPAPITMTSASSMSAPSSEGHEMLYSGAPKPLPKTTSRRSIRRNSATTRVATYLLARPYRFLAGTGELSKCGRQDHGEDKAGHQPVQGQAGAGDPSADQQCGGCGRCVMAAQQRQ